MFSLCSHRFGGLTNARTQSFAVACGPRHRQSAGLPTGRVSDERHARLRELPQCRDLDAGGHRSALWRTHRQKLQLAGTAATLQPLPVRLGADLLGAWRSARGVARVRYVMGYNARLPRNASTVVVVSCGWRNRITFRCAHTSASKSAFIALPLVAPCPPCPKDWVLVVKPILPSLAVAIPKLATIKRTHQRAANHPGHKDGGVVVEPDQMCRTSPHQIGHGRVVAVADPAVACDRRLDAADELRPVVGV